MKNMNGMKKSLHIAIGIFIVAVVLAALIVLVPWNQRKPDTYERVDRDVQTVVEEPEYVMDDEFRKEIVSEF